MCTSRLDEYIKQVQQKTDDYVKAGLRERHASNLANLEIRIAEWPEEWGNDFEVFIYGDFHPPTEPLHIPSLGIVIEPDKLSITFISPALCVLRARVSVQEKSLQALADAALRLNTLLGVMTALDWGNSGLGWWSPLTHDSNSAGMMKFDLSRTQESLDSLVRLPSPVARKVRSALFWIREPRSLMREDYRVDILHVYAGYWNAFECLVEAVCLLRPEQKMSKAEKQVKIEAFFTAGHRRLDSNSVSECYRSIIDTGFVGKASHALRVCFQGNADRYIDECFRIRPQKDRLYDIRNAINHGDIDPDNLNELYRITDRQFRLWMIVFGMLGLLLPIDRPLDNGPS